MSLLNRLNLFKRVKAAEDAEAELFNNVDQLIVGVEEILRILDKRSEQIRGLNARIFEMSQSQYYTSLDILSDLDAGIGDTNAT